MLVMDNVDRLDPLDLNDYPSSRLGQSQLSTPPLGGAPKRILDLVVAVLAIILFGPLMAILSLAIWSQRDGPIIFGQTRIGFNGKTFVCLKFRSMAEDSDNRLRDYLESNPAAKAEWLSTHKLRDDPRVTTLGKFLRKSSLDELPQLFNILRGDMSIVGPRPIVSGEVVYYDSMISSYMRTRPGLTGLWQISGRSETSYADRVAFDVKYTREWTIHDDISIMIRTVPAVLTSRGSY